MKDNIKKVLVSGGGGFVGNVLCRDLLARGYRVRCVDNFHKGQCDSLIELVTYDNFEFMYGDVTNEADVAKMVEGVDGIIHLAAIVGFPACQRQPSLAEAVNVNGTINLLNARDEETPFIFASTGSVYGEVENMCTEDSELNPVSLYGMTKREAEYNVREAPNTVSFRFATGFGVSPNMRVNLLVNDFAYQGVVNKCFSIFQADARRTFIHVKDMSRAFVFGLENYNRMKYNVYNCGADDLNWTKRELAEYVAEKTGAFISFSEFGEDTDKRDYSVSHERLNAENFYCKTTMEQGIDELIRVMPLLQINHQYM